jgi:hypothetical protein
VTKGNIEFTLYEDNTLEIDVESSDPPWYDQFLSISLDEIKEAIEELEIEDSN